MRFFRRTGALAFLVCAAFGLAQAQSARPAFEHPIACDLGRTCFIQNWVDARPGEGHADPTCGPLSYDGHDGVDYRVAFGAYRRGVNVLAPGAGVIAGIRDNEPDGVFLAKGRAALNNRECGNGVAIDHGAGWRSQLCHLAPGSVRVALGQHVNAGDVIGRVGLSGMTAFPHVHFSVRKDNVVIDPVSGQVTSRLQCTPGRALNSAEGLFRAAPTYVDTAIVDLGFVEAAPTEISRIDQAPQASGRADAPALIGWAMIMGPRTGDVARLVVQSPTGATLSENSVRFEKNQAQYALMSGKRRTSAAWPAGAYRVRLSLSRGDKTRDTREFSLVVR
jgi:hypothetical protein